MHLIQFDLTFRMLQHTFPTVSVIFLKTERARDLGVSSSTSDIELLAKYKISSHMLYTF